VSASPLLIHPGAAEHYLHPESYEARYAGRSEDIDYYTKLVLPGQRILEYGAGAGRLTLRLLRRDIEVCAVDASAPMLELLKRRALDLSKSQRGRLKVHLADMRKFRTTKRFHTAIAAFHTLGHLYSVPDIEAFLGRVFEHLLPGGKLVFDMPLPRIDMPEYDPIAGVRVTEMDGPGGPELLTQRWYQPQGIAMHLHYAGFTGIRLSSDFASSPVDSETSVYVVTALKPNAHAT
jgi:SAM-dependent methyltransferase